MSDERERLSKTQIDRLGDRLRAGPPSDEDVRMLDAYRRSFGRAYEVVVSAIRDKLHLEPTGRPGKSTSSIVEKLRRETIRLSQIQDIAGCRVVVETVVDQDRAVSNTTALFSKSHIVDRRQNPSFGYRAVHVIAEVEGKPVEIQVRTTLQHLWAEISERLSDTKDMALKYGGGPEYLRKYLDGASQLVAGAEDLEKALVDRPGALPAEVISNVRDNLRRTREALASQLAGLTSGY